MSESVSRKALKVFGGSAVAAMGFSFGRDVYKKLKKKRGALVGVALVFLSLLGTFTSGVWLSRNYQNFLESVWRRILALMMCIPSFVFLAAMGLMILQIADADASSAAVHEKSIDDKELLIALALPLAVFSIGLVVGVAQRKKRSRLWSIKKANDLFLESHGLIEGVDGTLEDSASSQTFRVEHVGRTAITLFPVGKRGKRAYIRMDNQGRFNEFTGIIAA